MYEEILKYWGKSKAQAADSGFLWHPLLFHALDCAAVAKVWLDESSGIRRELGVAARGELYPWILFFIYMHDYGKLAAPFQSKVPNLWKFLMPEAQKASTRRSFPLYQHGESEWSLFASDHELDEYDDNEWMKQVAKHHHRLKEGTVVPQCEAAPGSELSRRERSDRLEFAKIGQDLFLNEHDSDITKPPCPPPEMLAGFCSVCDWIASGEDFFPYCQEDIDARGYFDSRIPLAKNALHVCGLLHDAPQKYGMSGLYPQYAPKGVQKIVDGCASSDCSLAIIEAPTGSGKTEAALALASDWISAGRADSILFALPTQATANSMFERLRTTADVMFKNGANVVLAHGKARFSEGFRKLLENGRAAAEDGNEGAVQCSQWLGTSKKRAFLGQIGVCTIDQVLLGVLPVRHNFVRAFAAGRSVLVVDEVHSYDSYMNELLDKVLSRQKACKAPTILLSATLPEKRKKEIIGVWTRQAGFSPSPAYPLVTFAAADGAVSEVKTQEKEKQKEVRLELRRLPDALPDDAALGEITAYAKQGFKVAVICNLVADVQEVWRRLRSLAPEVSADIFHSRYSFADRDKIEQRVLEKYGKDRKDVEGGVIVASPVLEQSLDLDFDFMVTQICPVELLFQRLGRLYRHERKKRPDAVPRCIVLAPPADDFGLHALIYGNPACLWRARYLAENEPEAVFPEVYRRWIERSQQPLEGEPESITHAEVQWRIDEMGRSLTAAGLVSLDPKDLPEARASALTRDGEMSLNLIPVDEDGCLFDKDSTPLAEIDKQARDLGACEAVQLASIPCPAGWGKYLTDGKFRDGFMLLRVQREGTNWSYSSPSGKFILHYDATEGLRKG